MAPQKIDNRRDILLLLLYSPGATQHVNEPIVGRTRLMKMLFLFREEALSHFRHSIQIDDSKFYEFFPWNFGPFSRQVFDDLTFFILKDFIQRHETSQDTLPESAAEWAMWLTSSGSDDGDSALVDYNEEEFCLTKRGCAFAASLYDSLTKQQRVLLQEFKKRLVSTPLRAILKYVYKNYGKYSEKSQIKEEVLETEEPYTCG